MTKQEELFIKIKLKRTKEGLFLDLQKLRMDFIKQKIKAKRDK